MRSADRKICDSTYRSFVCCRTNTFLSCERLLVDSAGTARVCSLRTKSDHIFERLPLRPTNVVEEMLQGGVKNRHAHLRLGTYDLILLGEQSCTDTMNWRVTPSL